jgi:hypothetical protein
MPPPYEGSMSNASMGEWDSHATTSSTIHVPHKVFMELHPTNARRDRKHITYQIGNLHHWSNLEEDRHNHNTSKDTTRRTININHRKIKEEGEEKKIIIRFDFLLFLFFIFIFCASLYMCSIFCFIYFQHV